MINIFSLFVVGPSISGRRMTTLFHPSCPGQGLPIKRNVFFSIFPRGGEGTQSVAAAGADAATYTHKTQCFDGPRAAHQNTVFYAYRMAQIR